MTRGKKEKCQKNEIAALIEILLKCKLNCMGHCTCLQMENGLFCMEH